MTTIHDLEPVRDRAQARRARPEPHRRNRSAGAMTSSRHAPLSHRDRAILRAVDSGRTELVLGAEPDLYVDGLCCSDQFAAHCLAHAGLIIAAGPGTPGQRVPARLTMAGRASLRPHAGLAGAARPADHLRLPEASDPAA